MRVTFDHSQPETADITTFFFKPSQPIRYTAGQFIELTIPHEHPDERGIKHWFTLSSAPDQDFVSITTRFASKGSTFKAALRALTPGTPVTMSDPMGDFVLPKLVQTPLIFVAGGIGITPFHSMLEWLANVGETRPIKMLIGVRSEDDIIFQPIFERAKVHATIVVSNPSPAWGGERGQLDAELTVGLEKPSDDTLIYVSGPEPMVESLEKGLLATGIKRSQMVMDYFPGYPGV
jgi:ferredoxin-NADP reductase